MFSLMENGSFPTYLGQYSANSIERRIIKRLQKTFIFKC